MATLARETLAGFARFGRERANHGVGDAVRVLERIAQRARTHLRYPVTSDPISRWTDQLVELLKSASADNWDGYGALGLSREAVIEAVVTLQFVPHEISEPLIEAEPDGAVGVEWFSATAGRFAVSFSGDRKAAYSGVFPDGTSERGVALIGEGLPARLAEILRARFREI